jgi:hypothetical protein
MYVCCVCAPCVCACIMCVHRARITHNVCVLCVHVVLRMTGIQHASLCVCVRVCVCVCVRMVCMRAYGARTSHNVCVLCVHARHVHHVARVRLVRVYMQSVRVVRAWSAAARLADARTRTMDIQHVSLCVCVRMVCTHHTQRVRVECAHDYSRSSHGRADAYDGHSTRIMHT